MACIATWSFGVEAVQTAASEIEQGGDCVDVVERAINVVEDDPSTGCYYVGRGCYPNREGVVQLDAALMRGRDGSFGSVAALERYAKPISVARHLLDHPSLCMLVGGGATQFAEEEGFPLEDNSALLTTETLEAYEKFKLKNVTPSPTGHDTLSVLALDTRGHIAAGVSTSGPPFKPPGRVGDSPLPGCGLYADDGAGAAAATGDGEQIMRFCPSFKIVHLMRERRCSPQEACEEVVREMKQHWGSGGGDSFEVGVIALDTKGNGGAASTVREWLDCRDKKTYSGFPYAYWKHDSDLDPRIITQSPL